MARGRASLEAQDRVGGEALRYELQRAAFFEQSDLHLPTARWVLHTACFVIAVFSGQRVSGAMKIICTDGRFFEYVFPADVAVSPGQIAAMMRRNAQPDGNINSLCLDFAGSYLPLMHESEIRLASVLVATYHNAREREMALQASRLYSRAEAGGGI